MDVSIIIPTKNAGSLIDKILTAIEMQKTSLEYEIICVDSGSKDGTIEIIKKHKDVKLFEILPQEFGHGKTRNFGAAQGSGEFIVFITQDALPASDVWLEKLVSVVKMDPICAGAFGIHYPYEDCNIFDKANLRVHFSNFGEKDTYFWITDFRRYREDNAYRQYLCFYSDNNSCMRRSIWEKYPYDDVDFAEDQVWSKKIIELGYHKGYAAHAPVYHSHNYKTLSYFGRSYDEYKGLYKLYQYCMHEHFLLVPLAIAHHIFRDFNYIKQYKNSLSLKERIYWRFYAIGRNIGRYMGAWLGGHYHQYGPKKQEWLDCHISQQHKQICS